MSVKRALLVLLGAACSAPSDARRTADTRAPAAERVAVGAASPGDARFVANIIGFYDPESVRYDPDQDAYFVSNMAGAGSVKDGNGYITRVAATASYAASILVQGGAPGVTLNAPKGMAIHGDTLWVADIDVLRAFHRRTGAPLATIDLGSQGAVQLNDIAVAPDGTLRVTDTGILMTPKGVIHTGPDRVFKIDAAATVSVVAEGPNAPMPNGITWDSAGHRWIVVSFDSFAAEVASLGEDGRRHVLFRGSPRFDGVEMLRDGTIVYASWGDSSIHALSGSRDRRIIRFVPEPADLGLDTRRGILAIPLSTLGRVQLWRLGAR